MALGGTLAVNSRTGTPVICGTTPASSWISRRRSAPLGAFALPLSVAVVLPPSRGAWRGSTAVGRTHQGVAGGMDLGELGYLSGGI